MKWYVRRYQNPDGSLTELGKKRFAKGAKKRSVSLSGLTSIRDSITNKPGNKINELEKELEDSRREYKEYWSDNNRETRNKYFTLAACVRGLKSGLDPSNSEDRQGFAKYALGYLYGDRDQGTGNSFELYLLDRGISPNEYASKNHKAEEAYVKEVKKSVGEILGKYGHAPATYYSEPGSLNGDVNDIVSEAYKYWFTDSRFDYDGTDMFKSEENTYKQLIKKAKKFSGEYENLSRDELINLSGY